mmetsp:Transcript_8293/g.19111  ORF Transcript_8293/g.19111 Transcript_8293/m.19111 type:complete len:208 (-) Transcript_8293:270-893(-)
MAGWLSPRLTQCFMPPAKTFCICFATSCGRCKRQTGPLCSLWGSTPLSAALCGHSMRCMQVLSASLYAVPHCTKFCRRRLRRKLSLLTTAPHTKKDHGGAHTGSTPSSRLTLICSSCRHGMWTQYSEHGSVTGREEGRRVLMTVPVKVKTVKLFDDPRSVTAKMGFRLCWGYRQRTPTHWATVACLGASWMFPSLHPCRSLRRHDPE